MSRKGKRMYGRLAVEIAAAGMNWAGSLREE